MKTLNFNEVEEQSRTYIFPDGIFKIERVTRVAVSSSTHRIETADGKKFIVSGGWHAIQLDVPNWSF